MDDYKVFANQPNEVRQISCPGELSWQHLDVMHGDFTGILATQANSQIFTQI